jgi:hypothetical protein
MSEETETADSIDRLHRSGWSVGETAWTTESGVVWVVDGRNGENRIQAESTSQREAWRLAITQAREVGMLR